MRAARSVAYGRTDIGHVREENQDHYIIADLSRALLVRSSSLELGENSQLQGRELGSLYLIADGMGGHSGGGEAAQLAIRYFLAAVLNSPRWVANISSDSEERFISDLKDLMLNAHRSIQHRASEEQELSGMGSTLTMSYVTWPKMIIAHAGDTRCYLMRRGELRLITQDHTVANQLIQAGRLSPESEARSHWSNVLVNALGAGADEIFADIHEIDLESGDRLLLCSDGLNKHLNDTEIQQWLSRSESVQEGANALVEEALARGGSDNVTVIVADFLEEGLRETMKVDRSRCEARSPFYETTVPSDEVDTTTYSDSDPGSFMEEHPTTDWEGS